MMKKIITALLILSLISFLVGLSTGALSFVLFFAASAYTFMAAVCLAVLELIYKYMVDNDRKKRQNYHFRFYAIVLSCFILLVIGRSILNFYFAPKAATTFRLLAKAGLVIFLLYFCWTLIKQKTKTTVLISMVIFVVFIVVLKFCASVTSSGTIGTEGLSPEQIDSLPYVTWTPVENAKRSDKSGVTKYDRQRAFPGINIYKSVNLSAVSLMDMSGNMLHTWSTKSNPKPGWAQHTELCSNGDILVMIPTRQLMRLDWDSNLKWTAPVRPHHDIAVAENGDIYVLTRKSDVVFRGCLPVPIINDYITILSANGRLKKQISIFSLTEKRIPFSKVSTIYRWMLKFSTLKMVIDKKRQGKHSFGRVSVPDILHTNTVEIMTRDIEGFCAKGDLLISIRQLDLVAIVNVTTLKITWAWGPGQVVRQHHPTLLDNGNLLIFDNGHKRAYSRIVEMNPISRQIVWQYKADKPDSFFSMLRGANQRMPNGNTLITESDKGRVFEVTPQGQIVWEFYNPQTSEKDGKIQRAVIYRMMRITNPQDYPKVKELISVIEKDNTPSPSEMPPPD
jgi:hypothetical protein